MSIINRSRSAAIVALLFLASACGSSSNSDSTAAAVDSTATAVDSTVAAVDSTVAAVDSTVAAVDSTVAAVDSAAEPATTVAGASGSAADAGVAALFVDGALTSDVVVVDCTLENGSATSCYQIEVASLPSTVDTKGPYCPATTADIGGIWVWDGENPGLYALDTNFWTMMTEQGYDFVAADGTVSITDPGAGAASSSGTANSCLEATPDGSFHLQVLLPTKPEKLDEPVSLSTISQVGLALDGVTIFGDAPSVADRGGLPALDACGGHIDPSGYYHWHFGAESIQTNLDKAGGEVDCAIPQNAEALIGFSYDGFPIYGPEEDRTIPSDLDDCSGHVSDTADFGSTYHYHLTYDSPNLPACRVGAAAVNTLSSPDNATASLPGGSGPGGGGGPGGGPPPGGG